MSPRRWSGEKDTGARKSSSYQVRRVLEYLRAECVGIDQAKTPALIAERVGFHGRTLRDVLNEIDGRDVVIAQDTKRGVMWVAQSAPETLSATRSLRARSRDIADRANRRDEMAKKMPGGELL